MKNHLSIIAGILLILTACHSKKTGTQTSKDMNLETSKTGKRHLVELKKGELFVVAIADQKTGKEGLLEEYFNTIMPTAMQNGLSFIGQLHIDQIIKADNFTPNNFIGLFKWSSMESAMAFSTKFPPEKIKDLRTPIWNEFKGHVIAIQEDETLTMDEDKVYQVKVLWNKDMITANSIKDNGGHVLLNQAIVGYEDLRGNEAPNQIIIIEWDDKNTADSFKEMNLLKSQKEEAFYTHFTLFPK